MNRARFDKEAVRIETYLTRGDAISAYVSRRIGLLDAQANTVGRKNVVRRLRDLLKSKGKLRT